MQKRHLLFITLLTVIMPWVLRAQETLTVYEGTSTSNVIPAYIYYFDDFTRSQFVIPAIDLEIMNGSAITSIKFYATNSNIPYTTVSTADVYLKEVDYTTISAFEPKTNIVYQGTLDVVSEDGAGSLTIELATPYTYGGGNLLVGIENTTDVGWKNISFYGTSVTGASVGASDGISLDNVTPTQRDFIPKTTFTYEPVSQDCDMPVSIAVNNITADGAMVTWAGEGSQWNLRYKASTDAAFTEINGLTDTSYTLSGLNETTTYSVGVQNVCTGSTSFFRSTTFKTAYPCAAPSNLVVSDITQNTAILSWTPGYQETIWMVKYKKSTEEEYTTTTASGTPTITLSNLEGLSVYDVQIYNCTAEGSPYLSDYFTTGTSIPLVEEFDTDIPIGWSMYEGLLSDIMGGAALIPTPYYGWFFGAENGVFDNHACANIYSYYQSWLVMPSVPMENNVQLTFDIALTRYNGILEPVNPMEQLDDKFVVLITTDNMATWTVLRQWDNVGSEYVFDNIACSAMGEAVAIDLSSYAGQNIAIAFYGESTVDGGDNNLHIDNVSIDYIPACPRPTEFSVSDVVIHEATLSWTENGEATAWQICLNGDEEHLIDVTENPYFTLENLIEDSTYIAKVRANCGGNDGVSKWSTPITFTTLVACPAPNVVVNNITHTNAAVVWTGFSDSYIVSYREPSHYEFIDDNFETNALPAGWTNEGDATWTVGTGDNSVYIGAHSGSFNAKITHATNGNVTYLVTPAMNLSGKSGLSLNLWYINRKWGNRIDEFGIYYRVNGGVWNEVFSTTAAHSTWTELSVPLPMGAYVANCQIGFKYTDNYGFGVAIDDVKLGEEILSSEWQLVTTTTETNAIIPNLSADTYYEMKVQGTCDDIQSEESMVTFRTLSENQRVFVTEGNWNNEANWSGDIPNTNNEVIVRADATVPNGCVAEADKITFEGTPTPTLTISDGGQLKTNSNITATVKKNITGYGIENVETNNGYYLIAAPTTPSTTASDAGLITVSADNEPTYDFFSWDRAATDEEWQNTKNSGYYYLYNGNGYLYANLNDMEMSITGTMLRSDEPVTMTAYHDTVAGGWNLFGNPFPCNAYVYQSDGILIDVMFYDSNGEMVTLKGGPVAPLQGFFVKVTETTTIIIKSALEYVDLGLPSGLLWATCNVGATTPEGSGYYFAWGETHPKGVYSWSTYQYCNGNRYTMTKYCNNSNYGNGGFTDSLTTLLPEDDAATANMGAGWRMPTSVEWVELYNNTTNTWTTQNGVYGRLFTAPNGSTLFLPDAGYRNDNDLFDAGSFGYYWSSSLNTADPDCAKHFGFSSDYYNVDYNGRRFGYPVRGVRSSGLGTSFTATTEHQGGRTCLDPNNGQVNWTTGDQMVIGNDNGETAVFTLQSGEGTTEGVFGVSNGFDIVGPFIAAYPSDAVIENGKVTFNLPSTQAIAETETFANGANPMVAYSADNNLSFKNLCGGLGIRLKGLGAHVTAIRITSMDITEKLWGTYEVSNYVVDEPSLTVAAGNQGTNVITLTCDVILTTEAKTFFVMLPPGTLAAGFTVEVFEGDEVLTTMETTVDVFSVERNSLKFFNEILIDLEFVGNVEIPSDMNNMDIVVTNLGEDAIPDENGDFFIGYSTTLTMKNATNNEVIYMSIPSVDNEINNREGQTQNYDLNAKETALYYALTMIPFGLCQAKDATLNSIKNVLYDLDCVQALENAIEQSVNQNGYLRAEDIGAELNAVWNYLEAELLAPFLEMQASNSGSNLGHIVLKKDGTTRLEQPQLENNGRYRGIRLDIESASFNETSDTWTINLTGYSDNGVFIGMQKGSIGDDGLAYPIDERPHYFLPPMNVGRFMGTFTSFSGIASYFADTWNLFFEEGFGFDDMTWDMAKLENISFELNRNEDALIMLSPKDDQATAVVNGVYAIMQVVGMTLDDILTSRGYSEFFTSLFSDQELCATIAGLVGHPENFTTAANALLGWAVDLFATQAFRQYINPKYNVDKILDKLVASSTRALVEHIGNGLGMLASWYLFDSFAFTVEAEYNSILPTVSTPSCEVLSTTQAAVVAELESMGTLSVTEVGVCYRTTILPSVNDYCVSYSSIQTPGSYQCQLNNLQPNTTYYARAYAKCPLGIVVYGNQVIFTTGGSGFYNGHEYVDLGLPSGLLWATCNVGASSPEDYGDYFAWAETSPKSEYNWNTYQYCCNNDEYSMTKYCNKSYYGCDSYTDDLTILQSCDDPATANWGVGARTPTKEEWDELRNNTTNTWTTCNGVYGRLFTATNGNSLFLPAAGYWEGSYLFYAGSITYYCNGYYWSSSLGKDYHFWSSSYVADYPNQAWTLFFNSGNCFMEIYNRDTGRSVRPVRSSLQN